MSIRDKLSSKGVMAAPGRLSNAPVWKGPEEDGVTFSLLSRFLVCRERFRLLVVEGLTPADAFNHKIEYGQMWHICEEAHAAGLDWKNPLKIYTSNLCRRYPLKQEEIIYWMNVCIVQFPLYVHFWKKNKDVVKRTPLLQEQPFAVEYVLPSGRKVLLRGKIDSLDLIGRQEVYVQEDKTKGRVNEGQLKRQLTYDFQTMIYLTALHEGRYQPLFNGVLPKGTRLAGVRYNVVRRPAHHPGKKESLEQFCKRLHGVIGEDPGSFFMRWKVEVSYGEVQKFRKECLDPILMQLCEWWDYVKASAMTDHNPFDKNNRYHWRHPFGCYNVLDEGGSSELDSYLESGSETGLTRTTNLFPELS